MSLHVLRAVAQANEDARDREADDRMRRFVDGEPETREGVPVDMWRRGAAETPPE